MKRFIDKKNPVFQRKIHLNLHSREFRDEDRSDSRIASLHHRLLLSTSVSSSTSVYIFLPSTHSPLSTNAILQGRCSRKFCWRSRNGFSGVYFWIRRPYPLLTPCPVLPFAKSVITMRPVRSTYRGLSQTEPWRSRARLPRRKGE